jgi:DNA-binding MarR family transcriptional regulator
MSRLAEAFSGRRIEIMCAIEASIRTRGYPPTLCELGHLLGISEPVTKRHMAKLIRGGLLTRSRSPRSLAITPAGRERLGPFRAELAVEHLEMGA